MCDNSLVFKFNINGLGEALSQVDFFIFLQNLAKLSNVDKQSLCDRVINTTVDKCKKTPAPFFVILYSSFSSIKTPGL